MKRCSSLLGVLLATMLSACVSSPPRGRAVVDVDVRPPPPRIVVVPAPRRGYVWAPGHWRWSGRHHVWVDGRWVRERPGWRWVPAHWEERRGRWHFEPGHWVH
jgi:hypothetical protein